MGPVTAQTTTVTQASANAVDEPRTEAVRRAISEKDQRSERSAMPSKRHSWSMSSRRLLDQLRFSRNRNSWRYVALSAQIGGAVRIFLRKVSALPAGHPAGRIYAQRPNGGRLEKASHPHRSSCDQAQASKRANQMRKSNLAFAEGRWRRSWRSV
jgi:hypothetical protein